MQKNRSRGSFTQIRFPYPHRINRPIDSTSDEKTVWIPMRSWCAFGRSRKTPLQIPLGGEPLGPTKKQNSLFFREHSQNAFRWRPRPCVDARIVNRTSKFSRKRGKSVSGVAPVYPLMDCGSMSILCNIVVFFFFSRWRFVYPDLRVRRNRGFLHVCTFCPPIVRKTYTTHQQHGIYIVNPRKKSVGSRCRTPNSYVIAISTTDVIGVEIVFECAFRCIPVFVFRGRAIVAIW